MTKSLQIRRYSVLRTANAAALCFIGAAIIVTALSYVVPWWDVGQRDGILSLLAGIGITAVVVWALVVIVILVYNHLLAPFRCLRISVQLEDTKDKEEPQQDN